MKKICEAAINLIESGESFVQATILTSSGSTPRGAGSCMLILKDGSIRGTVGGGVLEAGIIKAAPGVIAEKKAKVVNITLDGKDAAAQGAICGGRASVLVDYIGPEIPGSLGFYKALQTALRKNTQVRLVTAAPADAAAQDNNKAVCRSQCILLTDGSLDGADGFNPIVLAALSGREGSYDVFTRLENHQVYLHLAGTDGTAYIFGAGHCGEKLAHVLSAVGFGTVVIDDRAEFANTARFPEADEILVPPSMDAPFADIEFDADSYIVIVTRGHMHDEMVLRRALRTCAGYVGMIGSRRKRETIYQHLLADGFTQDDIGKVYSPIGIQIGADTPEEIAVSIAAELIKVRAERKQASENVK